MKPEDRAVAAMRTLLFKSDVPNLVVRAQVTPPVFPEHASLSGFVTISGASIPPNAPDAQTQSRANFDAQKELLQRTLLGAHVKYYIKNYAVWIDIKEAIAMANRMVTGQPVSF